MNHHHHDDVVCSKYDQVGNIFYFPKFSIFQQTKCNDEQFNFLSAEYIKRESKSVDTDECRIEIVHIASTTIIYSVCMNVSDIITSLRVSQYCCPFTTITKTGTNPIFVFNTLILLLSVCMCAYND